MIAKLVAVGNTDKECIGFKFTAARLHNKWIRAGGKEIRNRFFDISSEAALRIIGKIVCYLRIQSESAQHTRKGSINGKCICGLRFPFENNVERLFRVFWNACTKCKTISRTCWKNTKWKGELIETVDRLVNGSITACNDD